MAKAAKMNFKTPLAELAWIAIDGEGKLKYGMDGSNGAEDYIYTATAILNEEQAKATEKIIKDFWKNNKPAGATKMSWDLVKPEMEPVLDANGKEQLDEDGEVIKKPTGRYTMMAKTVTQWPDGKPNKIKVLRANGAPINLGDTKIGNGSIGVIHGQLGISGTATNRGVSFYLNAIQLKKLVPYTGDEVEADDLGEDEGLEAVEMDNVATATPVQEEGPNI